MNITSETIRNRINSLEVALIEAQKKVDEITGALKETNLMLQYLNTPEVDTSEVAVELSEDAEDISIVPQTVESAQ
ncbi:MAG: hypothetical protein NTV01_05710 [Bacteroidia bacterium]|nr:hypothetical protein [Bacteroidia bacterium]